MAKKSRKSNKAKKRKFYGGKLIPPTFSYHDIVEDDVRIDEYIPAAEPKGERVLKEALPACRCNPPVPNVHDNGECDACHRIIPFHKRVSPTRLDRAQAQIAALQKDMAHIFNLVDKHMGEAVEACTTVTVEDMYADVAIELLRIVDHLGKCSAGEKFWKSPEGKSYKRDVQTLVRAAGICRAGGPGKLLKPNR